MLTATAAGVDISRELVEKQIVSKFVPRVIQRIAAQASAEIVEKWTARLIPVVSGIIGAGLNFITSYAYGANAHLDTSGNVTWQYATETRTGTATADSDRPLGPQRP